MWSLRRVSHCWMLTTSGVMWLMPRRAVTTVFTFASLGGATRLRKRLRYLLKIKVGEWLCHNAYSLKTLEWIMHFLKISQDCNDKFIIVVILLYVIVVIFSNRFDTLRDSVKMWYIIKLLKWCCVMSSLSKINMSMLCLKSLSFIWSCTENSDMFLCHCAAGVNWLSVLCATGVMYGIVFCLNIHNAPLAGESFMFLYS